MAGYLGCPFINLTNVRGLYSSDPGKTPLDSRRHQTGRGKARFISRISWDDFAEMAGKVRFKAGQHFVLDQSAAVVIRKKKIVTYIVGSLKAIDSVLKGKRFVGTRISEARVGG